MMNSCVQIRCRCGGDAQEHFLLQLAGPPLEAPSAISNVRSNPQRKSLLTNLDVSIELAITRE